MWKKRLIATVTFLGGLYFFLEFVVPATVPGMTVRGVVLSKNPTAKRVEVGLVQGTASIPVTLKTEVVQTYYDAKQKKVLEQLVPSDGLKPGDVVKITTPGQGTVSGIVTPNSSPRWIQVGKIVGTKSVSIGKHTLIRRMRSKGAGEQLKIAALYCARDVSSDWVEIGPSTFLSAYLLDMSNYAVVVQMLAWGMALMSLWLVHSTNIRKRRPEYYTSIIFFVAVVAGVIAGIGTGTPTGVWKDWTPKVSNVVFFDLLYPMGSTIFSLLTFYLASAAYRAFKAKSWEAVLMMFAALIVMLGQISLHPYLTAAGSWVLRNINTAAVRGMWFGMMLGGMAIGLRLWLSLERGAFFDREL